MTVPEQIFNFLKDERFAYCDDCIQSELKLARRQQVQQVTATLALTKSFTRKIGDCVNCFAEGKMVIRAN